jgi:hypothetical protein
VPLGVGATNHNGHNFCVASAMEQMLNAQNFASSLELNVWLIENLKF